MATLDDFNEGIRWHPYDVTHRWTFPTNMNLDGQQPWRSPRFKKTFTKSGITYTPGNPIYLPEFVPPELILGELYEGDQTSAKFLFEALAPILLSEQIIVKEITQKDRERYPNLTQSLWILNSNSETIRESDMAQKIDHAIGNGERRIMDAYELILELNPDLYTPRALNTARRCGNKDLEELALNLSNRI